MPEVLEGNADSVTLGGRVLEHRSGVLCAVTHRGSIDRGWPIVGRAPRAGRP